MIYIAHSSTAKRDQRVKRPKLSFSFFGQQSMPSCFHENFFKLCDGIEEPGPLDGSQLWRPGSLVEGAIRDQSQSRSAHFGDLEQAECATC